MPTPCTLSDLGALLINNEKSGFGCYCGNTSDVYGLKDCSSNTACLFPATPHTVVPYNLRVDTQQQLYASHVEE